MDTGGFALAGSIGSGSKVGGVVGSLFGVAGRPLDLSLPCPFALPFELPPAAGVLPVELPPPSVCVLLLPCLLAKELTQSPMPCWPEASSSLHVLTCCLTSWPQSAGFRLPVVAAHVMVTDAAGTGKPVRALTCEVSPETPL